MIVDRDFVWTHLPRTGGDSTASMFAAIGVDSLHRKDDYRKHDTFAVALGNGLIESSRRHLCNFRRLVPWLTSIGGLQLRYRRGLFVPSLALEGKIYLLVNDRQEDLWLARIDEVLWDYLQPRVDDWLRTEHLADDFLRVVGGLKRIGPEQAQRIRQIHENRGNPRRRIWTDDQCRRIYRACPLWASVERSLYGSLPY